jgi:hypothetical protein
MTEPLLYLGETNGRRPHRRFGILPEDRLLHLYVIGKTGVGKSSLIQHLARQDIEAGRGCAVIDPHGDLASALAEAYQQRPNVIYLDATDPVQPYGYNPLRRVRDDKIPLAASGLLETLRKLWPDAWGVRMEHVLRSTLYALLERDGSTLPDILRLYADENYRKAVVREIRNPVVRSFFKSEFAKYPWRYRAEAIAPIQNKLGALLSDPLLYRLLVEPEVDLRLRGLMDGGAVLLVNLAKGRIGEDSAATLGSILVSTLGLAGLSRGDGASEDRSPFFLYVDEFQTFTTLAFVNLMAELRKYGVGLVLAHQHFHQLQPDVQHAVLGNAGTVISFRVGSDDAAVLAREFQPAFDVEDLINLPNRAFYLKLMIDGAPSKPFSGRTLDAPGTNEVRPDDARRGSKIGA